MRSRARESPKGGNLSPQPGCAVVQRTVRGAARTGGPSSDVLGAGPSCRRGRNNVCQVGDGTALDPHAPDVVTGTKQGYTSLRKSEARIRRHPARPSTCDSTRVPPMPNVPTLLGVPFDAASSYLRGSAAAPPLIRRALASPSSNRWSESLQDLDAAGALADAGDLDLSTGEPRQVIERGARDVVAGKGRPLALGGDHSITYPLLRALRPSHPRLTVLHVDAHADLYEEFEGDRYSHACPFARVMEEGLADRLVQVGIRTLNGHQRAQADRYGVEVIDMRAWCAGRRPEISGPVYLSLDLDALDPAYAPGVSHWEPGGLSVREVISLVQGIAGPLVGADVVEYNPVRDPSGVTAAVAAKLVKEIASRMLEDPLAT